MTQKRTVVVTGTSRGLGQEISSLLVASGYTVVGVSRSGAGKMLNDLGDDYRHICWDLADVGSIKELVDVVQKVGGRPYGLVNNAALGTDGLLATMHNSEIERLVTTNLLAPIVLTKYLVRGMISARSGRVINIGSIVASTGFRGLAAYGATKAAMEGFARSLARDIGERRVTVNTVAPGFLATDMTAGLSASNLEKVKRRSALDRFATVAEVAAAVGFLLSDEASGITGTVLTVDAGTTA